MSNKKKYIFWSGLAIFIMVFSSCCIKKTLAQSITPSKVEGEWQLISINGYNNLNQNIVILNVDLQKRIVGGRCFCNIYKGLIDTLTTDTISLSHITSTRMACPDIDKEIQYLRALKSVNHISIKNDSLILSDRRSKLVFRRPFVVHKNKLPL